jgi:hypothetical protein
MNLRANTAEGKRTEGSSRGRVGGTTRRKDDDGRREDLGQSRVVKGLTGTRTGGSKREAAALSKGEVVHEEGIGM